MRTADYALTIVEIEGLEIRSPERLRAPRRQWDAREAFALGVIVGAVIVAVAMAIELNLFPGK